jgi:hypothetical protein
VVRDADVWVGGGSIVNGQLSIDGVAHFWAFESTIIAVAQVFQWRGRQVMLPGEFLTFASDGATDGLVSGYQLALP